LGTRWGHTLGTYGQEQKSNTPTTLIQKEEEKKGPNPKCIIPPLIWDKNFFFLLRCVLRQYMHIILTYVVGLAYQGKDIVLIFIIEYY